LDRDESISLHLFLSIVFLILLLKVFNTSVPESFISALFACVSMPATYALSYYHAQAYRTGKFVIKKHPEPTRMWLYELIALLTSFGMGFLVFVALSDGTTSDLPIYLSAFVTTQIMRLTLLFTVNQLRMAGVDVQHPLVVVLIALATSLLTLVSLRVIFSASFLY